MKTPLCQTYTTMHHLDLFERSTFELLETEHAQEETGRFTKLPVLANRNLSS